MCHYQLIAINFKSKRWDQRRRNHLVAFLLYWGGKSLHDSYATRMSGGGGGTHKNRGGMLVVSLRGVNFGFWSHLGCSGQNAIIYSCEGLL